MLMLPQICVAWIAPKICGHVAKEASAAGFQIEAKNFNHSPLVRERHLHGKQGDDPAGRGGKYPTESPQARGNLGGVIIAHGVNVTVSG
jgi:hypothetical protein